MIKYIVLLVKGVCVLYILMVVVLMCVFEDVFWLDMVYLVLINVEMVSVISVIFLFIILFFLFFLFNWVFIWVRVVLCVCSMLGSDFIDKENGDSI